MRLRCPTPSAWVAEVLADFDAFLLDHAACERKASAAALGLVAHYPDRPELVRACVAVAREELEHFERVWELLHERGLVLGPDRPNPYVALLSREFRKGADAYFLDRLLATALTEARGCERFGLVAAALPDGRLRDFYRELARTEVRHHELYVDLARTYFDDGSVDARMDELLDAEARVAAALPVRAAVY
ncbi:MAG TPA: tRNA-(ms[2]io[6]A)-hydroxylase [Thermoanaerobaculia bacterium]|jgi:tRNA-(ms[2]io[6]A)-hydroxylase